MKYVLIVNVIIWDTLEADYIATFLGVYDLTTITTVIVYLLTLLKNV